MCALFGGANSDDSPGVELKEVRFHSIREDRSARWHQRFENEFLAGFEHTCDDACLRVAADKRLPNDI